MDYHLIFEFEHGLKQKQQTAHTYVEQPIVELTAQDRYWSGFALGLFTTLAWLMFRAERIIELPAESTSPTHPRLRALYEDELRRKPAAKVPAPTGDLP